MSTELSSQSDGYHALSKPAVCTPIFVLGLQRSGTTWLSNMLFNHPDIAAVAAQDHQGVHESIFFSHFANAFGSLTDPSNHKRFVHNWQYSDYGILGQLPEQWYEAQSAGSNYGAFFTAFMDQVAEQQSASAWVEKSPHHSLLAEKINMQVEQAKFICIIRKDESLIASRLKGFGRCPPKGVKRVFSLVRGCAVNSLYSRYLKRLSQKKDNALLVRYEDLVVDTEGCMKKVLAFSGLSWDAAAMNTPYTANSSFKSGKSRASLLTEFDLALIRCARRVFGWVPLSLLMTVERLFRKYKGVVWPDWCWKRSGWIGPKDGLERH